MKYFTPDLFRRLQSSDLETADQADDQWEAAIVRYRKRLDRIRPDLPRTVRHLASELPLHDARVLSLARENGRFVVVLSLPSIPTRTVILTYRLAGEPKIDRTVLPPSQCAKEAHWLYDEIDLGVRKKNFRHDVLLSNGWEIRLPFRDVSIFEADGLLPSISDIEHSTARQSA